MVPQHLLLLIRPNYYGHPVARPHLLFCFGRCHFLIPILPVAHPHRMIEFPSLLPLSAFVLGFTFPGSNAKLLHTLQRRIMRSTVSYPSRCGMEWKCLWRRTESNRSVQIFGGSAAWCVRHCMLTYVYTDGFLDKKCMCRESLLQALITIIIQDMCASIGHLC